MKSTKFFFLVSFVLAYVLTACGGGSQTLGAFPNMSKVEGDAPFILAAPASKSPAGFTFTSSDPTVATVSGSTMTVVLAGTTTITASQPSSGSWAATSATAVLTVTQIVCTSPTTRVNGACVASCILPATRENGVCTAILATVPTPVSYGGNTFTATASNVTWDNANAFCTGTTINNQKGWSLPLQAQLIALFASGALNGQGWTLGKTWALAPSPYMTASYYFVDLSTGPGTTPADDYLANAFGAYVSCVR